MKTQREQMSVSFALQQDDALDANSFKGMASVFGNMIDTWCPTRILPGAFTKTLMENQKRIKVLYQHNQDWPIGVPTKMEENSDGLYVEARISETQMGKDCLTLMRDGVITELSIGFDPIKYMMVDEGSAGQVRHITECRLWEFSPVTFAANSQATISSVNSLFSAMRGETDITLSEETNTLIKGVFSKLRALPEADAHAFYRVLTSDYLEQHEGKVLSAKNRQLISDTRETLNSASDALQKLLDAAEPSQSKTLTVVNERLRMLDEMALDLLSRRVK